MALTETPPHLPCQLAPQAPSTCHSVTSPHGHPHSHPIRGPASWEGAQVHMPTLPEKAETPANQLSTPVGELPLYANVKPELLTTASHQLPRVVPPPCLCISCTSHLHHLHSSSWQTPQSSMPNSNGSSFLEPLLTFLHLWDPTDSQPHTTQLLCLLSSMV